MVQRVRCPCHHTASLSVAAASSAGSVANQTSTNLGCRYSEQSTHQLKRFRWLTTWWSSWLTCTQKEHWKSSHNDGIWDTWISSISVFHSWYPNWWLKNSGTQLFFWSSALVFLGDKRPSSLIISSQHRRRQVIPLRVPSLFGLLAAPFFFSLHTFSPS